MSTSSGDRERPGVVTFTAQGERALDRLAARMVDGCDGSPASIADILERVLSADVADLAEALCETTPPSTAEQHHAMRSDHEVSPADNPDQAARRRLARGQDLARESMSSPAPNVSR